MRHLRHYIAIALLAACITGSLGFACDRASALKNSRRVNSVLKETVTIFQANGLNAARLQEAIVISDKLIVALEAGTGGTDTLALVATLITAFNTLVAEDVLKIADARLRTIVLVSLAVANIALREIADALAEEGAARSSAAPSQQVRTIAAFRAQPKWRCVDAGGAARNMDYCKKNPGVATVVMN